MIANYLISELFTLNTYKLYFFMILKLSVKRVCNFLKLTKQDIKIAASMISLTY